MYDFATPMHQKSHQTELKMTRNHSKDNRHAPVGPRFIKMYNTYQNVKYDNGNNNTNIYHKRVCMSPPSNLMSLSDESATSIQVPVLHHHVKYNTLIKYCRIRRSALI